MPADEDLPCPISILPRELLEGVISHLDVGSVESFGSTCWYARYITAHSETWRVRAERIYGRPALNPEERSMKDLGQKYGGEWRTVLVEEERVRMDGCYIAVCHYMWVVQCRLESKVALS
jgi:F-box protein 9